MCGIPNLGRRQPEEKESRQLDEALLLWICSRPLAFHCYNVSPPKTGYAAVPKTKLNRFYFNAKKYKFKTICT